MVCPAPRLSLLAIAAVVAASAIGCGSNDSDTATAGGATPEEVFKLAQAAGEKEDWKTYCSTMTEESQKAFAAGIAISATIMKATANAEDAQKVTAMLERHGITEENVRNLMNDRSIKDPREGINRVIEPVKNHQQFVADMMATFKSTKGLPHRNEQNQIQSTAILKDTKITGDSATGIVETSGRADKPIAFRKVSGKWLIDLLGSAAAK